MLYHHFFSLEVSLVSYVTHSLMQFSVMQASILWRRRVTALAAEYPDVELSHMYVDNAAMQLVRDPKQVLIFAKPVSI